jgi:hypothetical protein
MSVLSIDQHTCIVMLEALVSGTTHSHSRSRGSQQAGRLDCCFHILPQLGILHVLAHLSSSFFVKLLSISQRDQCEDMTS